MGATVIQVVKDNIVMRLVRDGLYLQSRRRQFDEVVYRVASQSCCKYRPLLRKPEVFPLQRANQLLLYMEFGVALALI